MKYSIRSIVAVVLLLSTTLSANAQFENNRVTKRFHFGIRGGVSVNTYTGDVNGDPLVFPTGGFAFDFQLAQVPVYLGFGINYLNEGAKVKYVYYEYSYSFNKKVNASAIHIPLVFGYHFNVAPNFFISPNIGGFASYCVDDMKDNYPWKDDRFNYGLRFGLGMNFTRLTFDLAYDLGLKNLGYNEYKMHTGTFFATIGYNIAGSR